MKYCKKCLQPDTRPDIKFDENQICYACVYEEQKQSIDWDKRQEELLTLCQNAKSAARHSGIPYDCVIGVSGGKDSTFQAIYAKEKLGLRPLLVNCVPDTLTPLGEYNLENLASHGFDIIRVRTNPAMSKKLVKHAFFSFGNIFTYAEQALWASSFHIAEKFSIPFIILGENAAITLGTCMNTEADGNAFNVSSLNTLRRGPVADLPQDKFPHEDLWFYFMPDMKAMQQKGISAIWLQYYAKEWSQVGNADFSAARGLRGRMFEDLHDLGRYRRYTGLDSDFIMVNQMIKYLKFGFGFATDEACYDIREGRLTREDAVWYVKEYDGKCGQQYIDAFCKYIDISLEEFWQAVDKWVNKDLFAKDSTGKWQPTFEVGKNCGI